MRSNLGGVVSILVAAGVLGLGCKNGPPDGTAESTTAEAHETATAKPARTGPANILVVSSYHREYLWTQDTNSGLIAAFKEAGYIENDEQADTYTKTDYVETKTAHIKKLWMDTKRKTSQPEIAEAVSAVMDAVEEFHPDLVMLGDDNAANYVGNKLLDSDTPVVFWGINGLPVKYGLLESIDKPGHNVTGVYQAGYLKECVEFLEKIRPTIKTMGILSDDSPTGRSKVKALEYLAEEKEIPVTISGTVVTDSLDEFKKGAVDLAKKSDSLFVLNHNTIKDAKGNPVDQLEIGSWYLRNVKKPDCGQERQFAVEGLLATADDSGFNQGYEAGKIAHQILDEGANPAQIPVRAPKRGALILNKKRAAMLGIVVTEAMGAEEYLDTSLALEKFPH